MTDRSPVENNAGGQRLTARHPRQAVDWSALRQDFPILDQQVHGRPLIYFDNAATSQKPRVVLDALLHYYERDNANVHRGIHELSNRATAAFEAARVRAAKFLNARSADEIIFTRGTTEGINLVAAAWGTKFIKRGDKILLTESVIRTGRTPRRNPAVSRRRRDDSLRRFSSEHVEARAAPIRGRDSRHFRRHRAARGHGLP